MLAIKNLQPQMTFCDFLDFPNSEEKKSVSRQQTHQLVFLSLEPILATKNQNKKIQGSCYKGNITQTQINQKETEGKNGLPPISAFL